MVFTVFRSKKALSKSGLLRLRNPLLYPLSYQRIVVFTVFAAPGLDA